MVCSIIQYGSWCQTGPIHYSVPEKPWEESFGNHRAVLEVDRETFAAHLDLVWRRQDLNPQDRKFLIVSQEGDTVENIHRKMVNQERCQIMFGPVEKGIYYFYYLPFKVQYQHGFYSKDYLTQEDPPNKGWLAQLDKGGYSPLQAQIISIQSRTAFDSFYPMEVTALEAEKTAYSRAYPVDYLIFTEDRQYPVRMDDHIPSRWLDRDQHATFSGVAMRNEYYTFQVALWAFKEEIKQVRFEFGPLKNEQATIPATAFTCFNTEGVDPYGKYFQKQIKVPAGKVQSFWIGLDIAENTKPGTYQGTIILKAENFGEEQIQIILDVQHDDLTDRGDSEPWRHSRLRWLNSKAGIDNQPVHPYQAIEVVSDDLYRINGKEFTTGPLGLPGSIKVWGSELLADPVSLIIETELGIDPLSEAYKSSPTTSSPGKHSQKWASNSEKIKIRSETTLESDGWVNIKSTIEALEDLSVKDIRLEIPLQKDMASYIMGMGLPGQATPPIHEAKWQGPHDSFWIGNTIGGLYCELNGANYTGPLLNLYKPQPPESWHNQGKGGFRVHSKGPVTYVTVYSGQRRFKSGESIDFEFDLLVTPVKKLNTHSQFTNRYYHNGQDPWPKQEELEAKIKVINVHHANQYNPHINYPFIAVEEMKDFVDYWHKRGMKIKTYYTIRELTNYTTEIWALRSLGEEIFAKGRGGGYPWLREHLVDEYYPQWYDRVDSVTVDASILTSPGESRWFNYYVEGLKWLVKNVDIDGLYLDDVSFGRHMLKRMKKVMQEVKPGCIIDLHSNTGFSKGPAIQYTEFFPYVDKLWFGESFQYDDMPADNWLVEVSGIPFGLMGDMLHGGGNAWRGMVYGMTVRHPWVTEGVTCDPRSIWAVWDDFGISDSKMIGYWEANPLVKTGNPNVKATAYLKDDSMLIALASWADEDTQVNLKIDWRVTGLNQHQSTIIAQEIDNFQPYREFSIGESIPVSPKKGWLLVVK